jgi:uncharacterized protein YkwD
VVVLRSCWFNLGGTLTSLVLLAGSSVAWADGLGSSQGLEAFNDWLAPSVDLAQQAEVEAEIQQNVLDLVNAEREQAGAKPLNLNTQLNQAAQRHALDLARQGRLSHTGSDGSTMQTRIEATDYRWSAIGENIAMGQSTPEAVMRSWMESRGHRQNILNPTFSDLGVGYVEAQGEKFWVQVFATPR